MRRSVIVHGSVLALALAAAWPLAARTVPACRATGERPWLDKHLSPDCRADLLIARLATTEAKLTALANGFQDYGVEAAPHSDGPVGPTRAPLAISLPAPIALAASFNPAMMTELGELVGREFRLANLREMLGPTIDIARTWQFGRVAEDYGEEPVLTASMAVPYVRAIQAQGVAVTLKHFAVYGQEQGRTGDLPIGERPAVNVIVSERAVRELYLPAFKAAVVDGGALGVMCAFPRINGQYACEHPHLLGILKNEWRFRGKVEPDFPDAQRTVIAAINAGLDAGNFGLPRPPAAHAEGQGAAPAGMAMDFKVPGGIDLPTAMRRGKISRARLDDLLRRTLVSVLAIDGAPSAAPVDPVTSFELAQRVAAEGSVLLRNENGILPLGRNIRSIAVIGAQAGDKAVFALTGSANLPPHAPISAHDAMVRRAKGVAVQFAPGSLGFDPLGAIPTDNLRTPEGQPGLRADYVANANLDFSPSPVATRDEPAASSRGSQPVAGLPGHHQWSVRWTGTLVPRTTGFHDFTLSGSGSARLFVNGVLVARYDRVDFGTVEYGAIQLEANHPAQVRIEYSPRSAAPMPPIPMFGTTLGAGFELGWAEPDDRIARAVASAKAADIAIVFAANRQGEGADRATLNLSPDQDRLIEAVSAANPRTVVVLSTGGPIAMPWRDKVAGILEMWYSGVAFGPTAARLLFGDASPGGRLPITFPADATQGPGAKAANYPGETDVAGVLQTVRFDEGTLVGYRWFAAHPEQKPLYPFGYGLSYGAAKISHIAAHAGGGGGVEITAQVANAGALPGSQVVQAYLSLRGDAQRAAPKLVAFKKVVLAPNAASHVSIKVPESAFRIWDDRTAAWRQYRGAYTLLVGSSSTDLPFRQVLQR